MKTKFNVLGVSGSLRKGSYSRQALRIVLEHAKKQGAEVRLLEVNRLPLYDPNAQASKEVEQAAEAVVWPTRSSSRRRTTTARCLVR